MEHADKASIIESVLQTIELNYERDGDRFEFQVDGEVHTIAVADDRLVMEAVFLRRIDETQVKQALEVVTKAPSDALGHCGVTFNTKSGEVKWRSSIMLVDPDPSGLVKVCLAMFLDLLNVIPALSRLLDDVLSRSPHRHGHTCLQCPDLCSES
ncbi:Uncharacterized protein PBTT_00440 [Plasmodiophora brassicae]|uniref:Uncharacterized protein n=1 Tax=Plasmodiophora brassicae TaxID=37360 RepID=A0A3P3XZJ7_PLABS|nr:unnamed protein product [Plasmodiophora brassicae]